MADERLTQGIAAVKAGDKTLARQLLSEVVKTDPNNETAWLWLSACLDEIDKKTYCLKRVLSINPNNQNALDALAQLQQAPQPSLEEIAPAPPITPTKPRIRNVSRPESVPQIRPNVAATTVTPLPQPAASSRLTVKNMRKRTATGRIVLIGGILALGIGVIGLIAVSAFVISPDLRIAYLGVAQPPMGDQVLAATPTGMPTSTPSASVSCQPVAEAYWEEARPFVIEFSDTVTVANSTPRIALSPTIQDMQRIRRGIANIAAPSCTQGAARLVIDGMDGVIDAFVAFLGNTSDAVVKRKLERGLLDLTNGTGQLVALASGQPTPIPEKLPSLTPAPTRTPIPTRRPIPTPTPTPLPAGSSIVIRDSHGVDWEIRVTQVLVTDSLQPSYNNSIRKAAGRFAIVFMEVTNRGLAPETFIAFGRLDIRDASGQVFENDPVADIAARDIYGVDGCVDINPDESTNCVAVYDISTQSNFYVLVPGALADPNTPNVLLNVP